MRVGNKKNGDEGVYIGRPSPLGNPFVMGKDGSREDVVKKYTRWIWQKIEERDWRIMSALSELNEDDVLICWCHPLPCHGDVVVRAWKYCKEEGLLVE